MGMTGQPSNLAYLPTGSDGSPLAEQAISATDDGSSSSPDVDCGLGSVPDAVIRLGEPQAAPGWAARGSRLFKRAFDIFASFALLVMLLPLFAFIALRILLHDGRPVFFGSARIGRDGRMFKAWKFRSMVKDAETVLNKALENDEALRKEWYSCFKLVNDPRITPFGAMLRRTSLDELPQLWNVLRGDMSLVGPRPLLLDEPECYGPSFETYKTVRPGITGVWQITGRSDLPYAKRAVYNDWYIGNRSTSLDLAILWRTALVVLRKVGAR